MSATKPKPIPHIYDRYELIEWLKEAQPNAAKEFQAVMSEWESRNGELHCVSLKDHEQGHCEGLSPATIAFLRAELAELFFVRYWW